LTFSKNNVIIKQKQKKEVIILSYLTIKDKKKNEIFAYSLTDANTNEDEMKYFIEKENLSISYNNIKQAIKENKYEDENYLIKKYY
jgi:hypothetical protein